MRGGGGGRGWSINSCILELHNVVNSMNTILFVAWIGSLGSALIFFAGPVASRMTEKLNCRLVSISGSVTVTVGLILTSFAKSIIIYYFTYGLIVGFGACCIRTSSFLVIAQYFQKRKPLATGIVSAGAGLGLFIFAPLTQTLLDNFGLQNTFRILAAVFFVSGFPTLAYVPDVKETDARDSEVSELQDENFEVVRKAKTVDCSVWGVPTFTVFVWGIMMNCLGMSVPSVHLVSFSVTCRL